MHVMAMAGDREMMDALRHGVRGQVHSTFRSVINLHIGQAELLCLTSKSVAQGPRSIRLGLDRMDCNGIARGDVVIGDAEKLRIGQSLIIDLTYARAWESAVTETFPSVERCKQIKVIFGQLSPANGLTSFESAVHERVALSLESLREAVRIEDEEAICVAASSLAGLGIGLTPTGDDILTGAAFIASRLGGPLRVLHRAIARVVEDEPTNAIALTALRCALRGRAVQPVEALYAWLCESTDDDPAALVNDVKAIGHTSGTDLAHGLLTALFLYHEYKES